MKIGVYFNWQNHTDWERFLAKDPRPMDVTDQEIYDEELALAALVEPLGYDSYWAIDHYFTPYGMTGGALGHLTYMAGKTSRIDMGTMVTVLPWYDPLIVAHQVSVLDNVLQGRQLTLGLGRGASIREFDPLRIPMGDARGRFNETLSVLRRSMENEWFSNDGEFFPFDETTIRPAYRNPQRLLERMRIAWTSPETLPLAAHNGLGVLMTNQKSWDEYRADMIAFNEIRSEHGWAPTQPTVIVRAACFESQEQAWDAMARYSVEALASSGNHYRFADSERFKNTKGYESYASLGEMAVMTDEQVIESTARPQAWGTPDQVYDKLRLIQRTTGAEELVLNFKFGTMPAEMAEESMRLFAAEVLPRLHEMPATLDLSSAGASAGGA